MGMDPATLAAGALVLGGIGTATSVYGAYSSGQQAKAQANYQSAVARNNAAIATQNAKDTEAAGRAEEQRQRIANSQKLGAIRAEAGASGADAGSGTMLDSIADQTMIGEYDALTTRDNYQRQANSHYQQAANFLNDSSAYQTAASNAALNGTLSAGGSLLSGAGRVAGSWYQYSNGLASNKYDYGKQNWFGNMGNTDQYSL